MLHLLSIGRGRRRVEVQKDPVREREVTWPELVIVKMTFDWCRAIVPCPVTAGDVAGV